MQTMAKTHWTEQYPDQEYEDMKEAYDRMSDSLGRSKDLGDRLGRYARKLEWLNREYELLTGHRYSPKKEGDK